MHMILNELAHYMTTSFDDECIPQREVSIHLMLSATKEEAGLFTPLTNRSNGIRGSIPMVALHSFP